MIAPQQIKRKWFSRQEIKEQVSLWKKQGETIIFTNGCFDILHPGHVDYLIKAASLGTKLIIGLNTDASVSKLKGEGRPLQSESARAMVLASLTCTDAIVLFDEDTPTQLISEIEPSIIVKGADYKIEQVAGAEFVIFNGGSVVLLPYLPGFSTSAIERKIIDYQNKD